MSKLREKRPSAVTEIFAQAPYCAKRHWVRVSDEGALSTEELERWIRRSYDLVVAKLPKKMREALGGDETTAVSAKTRKS